MKKPFAPLSCPVKQNTVPPWNKNGNKIKKGINASLKKIPCEKFRLTSFDGLLLSSFLFFSGTLPALNTGNDVTRKQEKSGILVAEIREVPEAQEPEAAKMLSPKEMNGQMALPPPLYGDDFRKEPPFFAGNHLFSSNGDLRQQNPALYSPFSYPGLQSKDETIIAFYQNLKGVEASLQNQKLKIKKQQLFLYGISTLSFLSFSVLVFSGLKQKNLQIRSKWSRKAVTSKDFFVSEDKSKTSHPTFENKKLRHLYQQVLYLFENHQIFLDPSLNLHKIAKKLHTNEKYISRAIHQGSGENFPAFLSAYRLKETIKTMLNPLFNDLTLEEIRIKSGFYSQSTFSSTIKKHTGLAPGELKKYLQSQKTKNPVPLTDSAFPTVNHRRGSAPFQNMQ